MIHHHIADKKHHLNHASIGLQNRYLMSTENGQDAHLTTTAMNGDGTEHNKSYRHATTNKHTMTPMMIGSGRSMIATAGSHQTDNGKTTKHQVPISHHQTHQEL
jgi:hypothetical protein